MLVSVFTNGEPPVLLGANEGANPVEFLLHALAGCVTTTFVIHAAARGIRIESITTEMEGDIDLHGLLGMDDSVFPDRPWSQGDNPKTAVWEFLKENPDFEIDQDINQKLLISAVPDGWLRRKA